MVEQAVLPAGMDTGEAGTWVLSNKPGTTFRIVVSLKHHLKKVLITGEGKTQKP